MKQCIFISSVIFFSIFQTACGMFSGGVREVENGFVGRLSPSTKALPLPVEIAQDIALISEKGMQVDDSLSVLNSGETNTNVIKVKDSLGSEIKLAEVKESEQALSKSQEPMNTKVEVKKPEKFQEKITLSGPLAKRINKGGGPLKFAKIVKRLPGSKDGKTILYLVKLGDTLMKKKKKKYGNYLRWREIYQENRSKMKHWTKMTVGTELIIKNVKYVYIKKEGQPYLIKKGDTLQSISSKLYGRKSNWSKIWKNNPQLIQNPKKIYSGFTLYYQP